MKFIHTADLHLGKRYFEQSLIADQRHALECMLRAVDEEKPQGFIIAGDVYDKSVPTVEAVELFDWFLCELSQRGVETFIISGNHDSAERLCFGHSLMRASGVHIAPTYEGESSPVTLKDKFGEVDVWLLPFIKPASVKRFLGEDIKSYTQAVERAIDKMAVDENKRNVLIAHQFVTNSKTSGSEEMIVGELGNVDAAVFAPFDYVALGHIHGEQQVGAPHIRYSGTPLKYSLSEAASVKSITVAELNKKGSLSVRLIPITPLKDVVEIRGSYDEITSLSFYSGTTYKRDFVHVVLTDEEEIPDAMGKLRTIYPNVMSLRYDNVRTRAASGWSTEQARPDLSPLELLATLYKVQNGQDMTDEQTALAQQLISKIWEDER